MASTESARLTELYDSWNARRAANQNEPIGFLRGLFHEWSDLSTEATEVWYETIDGPVPGLRAVPIGADPSAAILYVHGGGYIGGSSSSHRKVAAHFAKAIGMPAFVPDYRLAPEHRYPAPLDDVRTAFDWIVEGGVAPSRIVVIGDSAGGALATALAQLLRDEGAPVPGAVVALSPYYDTEGLGDSFDANIGNDVLSGTRGRDGIRANVAMFIANESQRTHPYVTALRCEAEGLPPHFLSVGSAELLSDGVRLFAQKLRAAGVDLELEVAAGMQHVFQLMAGRAPEADASIRSIAAFVLEYVPADSEALADATD